MADRYAGFRPHYPPALFDYLATLVPASAHVWDCAAGNGQATVDLAARFTHVTATDASPQQIASATGGLRVEYRVALAEDSGLPDSSVSLVTVAQALHWFDLPRFFAEASRVLTPGGVLAVWAYGVNTVEGVEANRLMQDYYHRVVGPYWPPERRLVEDGYRSVRFPVPFVELQPPPLRMEASWTLDQLLGYLGTWSATTRCARATDRNPLEPFGASIAPVWGDRTAPRRIVWPITLKAARTPERG